MSTSVESKPQANSTPFANVGVGRWFLLAIVTLGIYIPFWAVKRTKEFNQLGTAKKVPNAVLGAYLLTYVAAIALVFVMPLSAPICLQINHVLMIVLAFTMRSALLEYDKQEGSGKLTANVLVTLIFPAIYIEDRIARHLKLKG